jgi:hypothetical protein
MAPSQVIRVAACSSDDVRAIFAGVRLEKVLIHEGDDFEAAMRRGQCFKVLSASGKKVGAYVLQPCGGEVWISAGAGSADFDLTVVMSALIDQQSQDFDSIAFQTRRRGLVRKARQLGYRIAGEVGECGIIMRKNLK